MKNITNESADLMRTFHTSRGLDLDDTETHTIPIRKFLNAIEGMQARGHDIDKCSFKILVQNLKDEYDPDATSGYVKVSMGVWEEED